MCPHTIFTLNRPFKRRVHNNYWSFPTIDGGDGFERPKAPISRLINALEVLTRPIHGHAQIYSGLGGHACAQHGHIVGRAQVERRRCCHLARNMFWPNPRRKNREGRSTHNSPAKLSRCCDFIYRFEVIFVCFDPDFSLSSATSSGRCGRTRRAGGGQGRCLGHLADVQRSVRVCMPFCGLGSVSHTQDVNRWCSCISRSNA